MFPENGHWGKRFNETGCSKYGEHMNMELKRIKLFRLIATIKNDITLFEKEKY